MQRVEECAVVDAEHVHESPVGLLDKRRAQRFAAVGRLVRLDRAVGDGGLDDFAADQPAPQNRATRAATIRCPGLRRANEPPPCSWATVALGALLQAIVQILGEILDDDGAHGYSGKNDGTPEC
ncbi:MAG: hypothetical protein IPH51_17085 [Rubrivivax sp.]|nr:hypothetical protein [Rubrivivax sp.]